ncbi:hypothetical protein C8Q78DRAFT_823774 [Trametes maxima]|nr:hypothetical protein C8Q78DRAFT_823774 [Trametes maxima]
MRAVGFYWGVRLGAEFSEARDLSALRRLVRLGHTDAPARSISLFPLPIPSPFSPTPAWDAPRHSRLPPRRPESRRLLPTTTDPTRGHRVHCARVGNAAGHCLTPSSMQPFFAPVPAHMPVPPTTNLRGRRASACQCRGQHCLSCSIVLRPLLSGPSISPPKPARSPRFGARGPVRVSRPPPPIPPPPGRHCVQSVISNHPKAISRNLDTDSIYDRKSATKHTVARSLTKAGNLHEVMRHGSVAGPLSYLGRPSKRAPPGL